MQLTSKKLTPKQSLSSPYQVLLIAISAISLFAIPTHAEPRLTVTQVELVSNDTIATDVKSNEGSENPGEKPKDTYMNHYFGQVFLNQTATVRYNVKNTGDSDLEFSAINYSGIFYTARTRCPKNLKPQESCDTYISFSPSFEGYWVGNVDWLTNGGNIYLDLSGSGVKMPF